VLDFLAPDACGSGGCVPLSPVPRILLPLLPCRLSPLSEPFPVEPNTSVWMLKSEALKRHRRHSPELVGEDDVLLHPLLDGRPGPPLDDNTLAAAAGLADGQVGATRAAPTCTPPGQKEQYL
jgi:hypothetical protein